MCALWFRSRPCNDVSRVTLFASLDGSVALVRDREAVVAVPVLTCSFSACSTSKILAAVHGHILYVKPTNMIPFT
jgi:hypothetical protein